MRIEDTSAKLRAEGYEPKGEVRWVVRLERRAIAPLSSHLEQEMAVPHLQQLWGRSEAWPYEKWVDVPYVNEEGK